MIRVFVIWGDYDGQHVDSFATREDAEECCATLLGEESLRPYGKTIYAVIQGNELQWDTVEVVSKVKLKEKI